MTSSPRNGTGTRLICLERHRDAPKDLFPAASAMKSRKCA